MCPRLAIEAAGDSHVGRRRNNNEDSFAALPELRLFMVADGLGGKPAGEVASRMAINTVRASLEEEADLDDTWPPGIVFSEHRDEARFALSVQQANRCIFDASRYREETRGMATTFAGVLLSPVGAFIAHVGDSRVYRFRAGRLEQITRDHTVFEELVQRGYHIQDFGGLGDQMSAITRALGSDTTVEVDTRVERAEPGDVFLVCSDGLWVPVPSAEIGRILSTIQDLSEAIAALIDRANEYGGPDNVTCVLARIGEE